MIGVLIAVKRLATFIVVAAAVVLVAPLVFGYAILKTEWLRLRGKPSNPTEARLAAQVVMRDGMMAGMKADWSSEEVLPRLAISPTLMLDDSAIERGNLEDLNRPNRLPNGMHRTYLENP
jgi:hypothetical protein